jgi:hypothetical protein
MDSQNVQKVSEINLKKIVYDEIVRTKNDEFIIAKIWYMNNSKISTLNVQTSNTQIINFVESTNSLILNPLQDLKFFMENLDQLTCKFINDNQLVKKLGLVKYTYKTLISEMDTPNNCVNVLSIKIATERRKTLFFSSKNKQIIEYGDVKKLFAALKIKDVKIIFEVDGMIIDIKKKRITTNIIARHILLNEIIPQKIELTDYSFIDSDDEDTIYNDKIDENDIILNSQTDCCDNNNDDNNDNDNNNNDNDNNDNNDKDKCETESDNKIYENDIISSEISDSDGDGDGDGDGDSDGDGDGDSDSDGDSDGDGDSGNFNSDSGGGKKNNMQQQKFYDNFAKEGKILMVQKKEFLSPDTINMSGVSNSSS